MARKTHIKVKDVMTSVKKTLNNKVSKKAEELLIKKVEELEKAKAIVRKLEKEIDKIQDMDLTDLIDYLGK